jgi:hypothetical protein
MLRDTRLIVWLSVSMPVLQCLAQPSARVASRPADTMARDALILVKEAAPPTALATAPLSSPRDREVLDGGMKCASALLVELAASHSPITVSRFDSKEGDSWTYKWQANRCPANQLCVVALTDTPGSTLLSVRLPEGELMQVLDRAFQWAKSPVSLGRLTVYTDVAARYDGTVAALIGGVPGSEWAGGFGFWGTVQALPEGRVMRVLLGKRHCNIFYPRDLYFVSKRFSNLSTGSRNLSDLELLAETKKELRLHNFTLPAAALQILLDEVISRNPGAEMIRDLIHEALWPLDSYSRFRMQELRLLTRNKDIATRSIGVLAQEINGLVNSDRGEAVEIVDDMFKSFSLRDDGVSVDDIALALVEHKPFAPAALRYILSKSKSEATFQTLRGKRISPEFETMRQSALQKIRERLNQEAKGFE